MSKIKKILEICEKINRLDDFNVEVIKTALSTTIILTDEDASYEEVINISNEYSYIDLNKERILEEPEHVHIISEGEEYTKLTLEEFYNIFIENWSN